MGRVVISGGPLRPVITGWQTGFMDYGSMTGAELRQRILDGDDAAADYARTQADAMQARLRDTTKPFQTMDQLDQMLGKVGGPRGLQEVERINRKARDLIEGPPALRQMEETRRKMAAIFDGPPALREMEETRRKMEAMFDGPPALRKLNEAGDNARELFDGPSSLEGFRRSLDLHSEPSFQWAEMPRVEPPETLNVAVGEIASAQRERDEREDEYRRREEERSDRLLETVAHVHEAMERAEKRAEVADAARERAEARAERAEARAERADRRWLITIGIAVLGVAVAIVQVVPG